MSRITMFVLGSVPLYLRVETFGGSSHCCVLDVSYMVQNEQDSICDEWKMECINITYTACVLRVIVGFGTSQTGSGLTSSEIVVTSVGVGML